MEEQGLDQEIAQLQNAYTAITEFLVQYSFSILGAIIIFLIGLWIASKVANLVTRIFEKHEIDITLSNFTSNFVRILIIVMVGIIALGKLGISVTPMVAAIGAASLGAGLALQGMLANYAAGITIIVTRPFIVGNTIEIKGVGGLVKDIHLGMTVLTNEEGEEINIPNKHIVGEILHNSFANKLVETKFNISYQANTEEVVAMLAKVLADSPRVFEGDKAQVGINDFNSIGIEIGIRYWVPTESYFQDKYQTNAALFKALKTANIEIPCPVKQVQIQEHL
ncbi:mechanosensitive ion channel family protein [Shewanella pneumatophori]|uniref:Small-conductance mechanosensitive channel n=1 Tax=Shewanella pneumatophori TaxID=314092 RepID=A0A9X2CHQ3_9GAMM|nr:mechanosensitive ion channel family protein [Shewanella pneumatophori]MCL1140251.1 mechanosensitive ion channel family protein [Shewanella pneumatophori]